VDEPAKDLAVFRCRMDLLSDALQEDQVMIVAEQVA
jgi:hypothetical protein